MNLDPIPQPPPLQTIPAPASLPIASQINTLLDQLQKEKLGEIKAEKVSSKATLSSRLNIEQTAHLKRLKMYIIFGSILIVFLLIAYAALSAYTEYKDIVTLINSYGPQANVPISGFKLALCIRFPPLTSWFLSGNTAFPEAIFVAYRTPQYRDIFVNALPDSLTQLYSVAQIGCPQSSANTSAAFLICCCKFASDANLKLCQVACNSNNSTSTASSALSGVNMGLSVSMATAGIFPPFGFIGGFIAGFCGGFFSSEYPPGVDSSQLNQCIS